MPTLICSHQKDHQLVLGVNRIQGDSLLFTISGVCRCQPWLHVVLEVRVFFPFGVVHVHVLYIHKHSISLIDHMKHFLRPYKLENKRIQILNACIFVCSPNRSLAVLYVNVTQIRWRVHTFNYYSTTEHVPYNKLTQRFHRDTFFPVHRWRDSARLG